MNPFKFLWCYFVVGHKWDGGGHWSMCWRCKHLHRNLSNDYVSVSDKGIGFTGRRGSL